MATQTGPQPGHAQSEQREGEQASLTPPPASTPSVELAPPHVELRHERESTPWLGVELRATAPTDPGVDIVRVLPGSPAENAGILKGDTLLTLADTPMNSPSEVGQFVRSQTLGQKVAVSILRAGAPRLFAARLEGIPVFEDQLRLAFVGRYAPEISGVVTFQGEAASLGELKGQVVILEFWASFCQVCRVMAPLLDQWHRSYSPLGVEVVGITVDAPQTGLQVARRVGMTYTLASDQDATITRKYMASQIPAIIVIDRRGVVRDAMVGYSPERMAETEALISRLLKEDS
jgi:peroxiredoxin